MPGDQPLTPVGVGTTAGRELRAEPKIPCPRLPAAARPNNGDPERRAAARAALSRAWGVGRGVLGVSHGTPSQVLYIGELSSLRKRPMPPPKIRPPNMTMTPTRRIRTNFTTMLQLKNRPPAGPFDPSGRPQGSGPPTTAARKWPAGWWGRPPRTAPAPCRTKPAAGMSRVDPVGGLVQPKRIDPPAREHIVTKVHVRELKSTAVTPECRRSAASGMRRTIAPRPFA